MNRITDFFFIRTFVEWRHLKSRDHAFSLKSGRHSGNYYGDQPGDYYGGQPGYYYGGPAWIVLWRASLDITMEGQPGDYYGGQPGDHYTAKRRIGYLLRILETSSRIGVLQNAV